MSNQRLAEMVIYVGMDWGLDEVLCNNAHNSVLKTGLQDKVHLHVQAWRHSVATCIYRATTEFSRVFAKACEKTTDNPIGIVAGRETTGYVFYVHRQ